MHRRVIRDVVREKLIEVHDTYQDPEDTELSTEEFDALKSRVFSLHSI